MIERDPDDDLNDILSGKITTKSNEALGSVRSEWFNQCTVCENNPRAFGQMCISCHNEAQKEGCYICDDDEATLCKSCGSVYCKEHGKEHIENWDLYHPSEEEFY